MRYLPLLVLVLFCCASVHARRRSVDTRAAPVTYSDPIKITDRLAEGFEALGGPNNSAAAFVQGKSIKGWFSSQSTYIVSDGTNNAGGLYSFGSTSERALGAINSIKTKTVVFGIAIVSDVEIHEVDIKFTGEQWRFGGDVPDTNTLIFDYSVLTTDQYETGGWGANVQGTSAMWTVVPELSFAGSNATDVGPVRYTQQFSRALQTHGMGPDKVLQLRWTARNNHDGLAIDDFEIYATTRPSGGGGSGIPRDRWKILAIAGWTALGMGVVAVLVFAVSKWKKHRKQAYYMSIHPDDAHHTPPTAVHAPGIYNNYAVGERQGLISV